ncbi:MAG: sulfotransferase domain-containing protein [Actinomycetota bacterium]
MSITGLIAKNDLMRSASLGAYRAYARSVLFLPPPKVLVNSIPKAGTHLLAALLKALPRMMFSGLQLTPNDYLSDTTSTTEESHFDGRRFARLLASVRNGQFVIAHFPTRPELPPLLDAAGFRSLLMIRDPRDIAVSHCFYVRNQPRHPLHRRYTEELRTDKARLLASIVGLPGNGAPSLEDIGTRLDSFSAWLDKDDIHVCRFESLVGPSGGGSADLQRKEVEAVARRLNRQLSAEDLDRVAQGIWSRRTATFRRGRIGDWRNHFSQEHKSAFKELAGRHLIDLGYERDTNW